MQNLQKSPEIQQPLPSHNQQHEHMLEASMTLRKQDHKISECSRPEKGERREKGKSSKEEANCLSDVLLLLLGATTACFTQCH